MPSPDPSALVHPPEWASRLPLELADRTKLECKCGNYEVPLLYVSPHQPEQWGAYCQYCRSWIKWVSHTAAWLDLWSLQHPTTPDPSATPAKHKYQRKLATERTCTCGADIDDAIHEGAVKPERPPLTEPLTSPQLAIRPLKVQNGDGWIELGYVDGMPEFTVLQITFLGDWLPDANNLHDILEFATRQVCRGSR